MDKVKQIFKSDSDKSHSADHTTSHSHGTTAGAGASDGLSTSQAPRSSIGSSEHSGAGRSSVGTDSTLANSQGITREEPSLKDHVHNIKQHHELPREGDGLQTHDHKHLAAVTKEKHHTHETEEVIREREHDRHVHHVQHHVQPLKDEHHRDVEHVSHTHAPTHIQEQHTNAAEDTHLLGKLASQHRDEVIEGGKERVIVDKGETVKENTHHHVHHLVQPVIERDEHHHKTIHTTIPIKHVTHEAPIIHQSSTHEPMHVKDFLKQGGDLTSKLGHHDAGVLANGKCERSVDGPAEELARKLHLGSGSTSNTAAGSAASAGGISSNNGSAAPTTEARRV